MACCICGLYRNEDITKSVKMENETCGEKIILAIKTTKGSEGLVVIKPETILLPSSGHTSLMNIKENNSMTQ